MYYWCTFVGWKLVVLLFDFIMASFSLLALPGEVLSRLKNIGHLFKPLPQSDRTIFFKVILALPRPGHILWCVTQAFWLACHLPLLLCYHCFKIVSLLPEVFITRTRTLIFFIYIFFRWIISKLQLLFSLPSCFYISMEYMASSLYVLQFLYIFKTILLSFHSF